MLLKHQEVLTDILLLTVLGSERTGKRICHDVTAWGNGSFWSQVRVIEDGWRTDSATDPDTAVVVEANGEQSPLFSTGEVATLSGQREALVDWIAANRQGDVA